MLSVSLSQSNDPLAVGLDGILLFPVHRSDGSAYCSSLTRFLTLVNICFAHGRAVRFQVAGDDGELPASS